MRRDDEGQRGKQPGDVVLGKGGLIEHEIFIYYGCRGKLGSTDYGEDYGAVDGVFLYAKPSFTGLNVRPVFAAERHLTSVSAIKCSERRADACV